jgi:hypothetical protein
MTTLCSYGATVSATLLQNGKVLVAGCNNGRHTSPAWFDRRGNHQARVLGANQMGGISMRKMLAALSIGVVTFMAVGACPVFAKPTPPPPLTQLCSASSNGGVLVNGVCVLPDAIAGGGHDYFDGIIASNTTGSDTFTLVSGALPPGLSMPASYGPTDTVILGTASQVGTFIFGVRAAVTGERLSSVQTYQITVDPPPADTLVCTPSTNGGTLSNGVCVLPGATVGQQYEGFIITSNNAGGTFAITAGSLPPGLSMPAQYGASGTIAGGTPTKRGTFAFTVVGTDQEGQPLGPQIYSISVSAAPPLTISFPATCCNPGTLGQSYLQNFALSGGVGPFSAAITSGALPPGLTLSRVPPLSITGTPTAKGTFTFTFTATDGTGAQATEAGSITVS